LLLPARHPRVARYFIPQALHLGLGLLQASLQGRAAPKRSSPRTGPHAHAVLGHAIEIDQTLLHQGGHTVGEQLIQEIKVRDAKVSQGVIVDLNPATEPAEAVVVGA
jgi:hypothetical protein